MLAALGLVIAGMLMRFMPEAYVCFLRETVLPRLNRAFAWLDFPAAELLTVCVISGIAAGLLASFKRALKGACVFLAILFFIYAAAWTPLYSPNAASPLSDARLYELSARLADEANALYGAAKPEDALREASIMTGQKIKAARYPEWMNAFRIAGIYLPVTFEIIVNPEESDQSLPFTACHEAAHAMGYASEAEANLRAYEMCVAQGGYFAYCAKIAAARYALILLKDMNYELFERAAARLSSDVLADVYAIGGFEEIRDPIGDMYLKLHGQSGYMSYAEFVYLLS